MVKKDVATMKLALSNIMYTNNTFFSNLSKYIKSSKLDDFYEIRDNLNDYQTSSKQAVIDKITLYYWE